MLRAAAGVHCVETPADRYGAARRWPAVKHTMPAHTAATAAESARLATQELECSGNLGYYLDRRQDYANLRVYGLFLMCPDVACRRAAGIISGASAEPAASQESETDAVSVFSL